MAPTVKGGIWKNVEDEILKAAVSKYGKNQWARISSLLVRKTAKQCKARWYEWLDPGIKKIEWAKEEDEKLLHLAKLMPTQWRTVATIVGRTATQCLERYQKLLDDAEMKESNFNLDGPGNETSAPTADDVRRLRPGEIDPNPENKPALPDAVDMDEDEKEMLSEARARLANTQGKKAKRKAREKQLEESRRLAVLQKRRELKAAGINIRLHHRKKGQMDYNADIPFEKKPALGFYDTTEEQLINETIKNNTNFRQLEEKKKDQDDTDKKKRKKEEFNKSITAVFQASENARNIKKLKDAEKLSKRRKLVLPDPQINDNEVEEVVKLSKTGEYAKSLVSMTENEVTKGFIDQYSHINTTVPIRTPRISAQEDNLIIEARNLKALTQQQSSLFKDENTPFHQAIETTFNKEIPKNTSIVTPNPLVMSFSQNNISTKSNSTPFRTPRDDFNINQKNPDIIDFTHKNELYKKSKKEHLHSRFLSLPKPLNDFELELPIEEDYINETEQLNAIEEDVGEINRRIHTFEEKQEISDLKKSQVIKRSLPRPQIINMELLLKWLRSTQREELLITEEMIKLLSYDASRYPILKDKVISTSYFIDDIDKNLIHRAHNEIQKEMNEQNLITSKLYIKLINDNTRNLHNFNFDSEKKSEKSLNNLKIYWKNIQENMSKDANKSNEIEKKLNTILNEYQIRSQIISKKIYSSIEAISFAKQELCCFKDLSLSEKTALPKRLNSLKNDLEFLKKRELEEQKKYQYLLEKKKTFHPKKSEEIPGIIYLSKIPPFMKPETIKHLLSKYGEIGRIFLVPEDYKSHAKRIRFKGNKKKKYIEGWVEFKEKKKAKLVANILNTSTIGGKSSTYYHNDIWNIKYLPKFKWNDLQEQITLNNSSRISKLKANISRAKRENQNYIKKYEHNKMIENIKIKKLKTNKNITFNSQKKTGYKIKQRKAINNISMNTKKKNEINEILNKIF
ncbi:hypothetical protein PCANB_000892 [Pneumocystis canis]|nr:hypothetical protein PCANB_000892 [Pneumocystis canis]